MNQADRNLMEVLYAAEIREVKFHEIATHFVECYGKGMYQEWLPAIIYRSALHLQAQGFAVILDNDKNINHYTLCATRKGQAHYDQIIEEMQS